MSINERDIVLQILLAVFQEGEYSHLVLQAVLDKYEFLDKRQRAFITRVAEGTIERRITLDHAIDSYSKTPVRKMKPMIRNVMRMSAYQILFMDGTPDSAVCNEAVKLIQKRYAPLKGFVNGVLRNISRNKEEILSTLGKAGWSVEYSMPQWIIDRWFAAYGKEVTLQILQSAMMPGKTCIRTNLARITPEELVASLMAEGVTVEPVSVSDISAITKDGQGNIIADANVPAADLSPDAKTASDKNVDKTSESGNNFSDYSFYISGYDHLTKLLAYQNGWFYIQDVSSMSVAESAGIKPGDQILDVCAAPGGKSLHMAEVLTYLENGCKPLDPSQKAPVSKAVSEMTSEEIEKLSHGQDQENSKSATAEFGLGHVEARDLSENKVSLIRENIARSGLANITARQWDATRDDEAAHGKYDIVIADLPCSGLGVLGRKADIRYRVTAEDTAALSALQKQMLDVVYQYVKVGGTLLYSTCTINKEENEDNVAYFLEQHPEFTCKMQKQILPRNGESDGFFVATFTRVK